MRKNKQTQINNDLNGHYSLGTFHVTGITLNLFHALSYLISPKTPSGKFYYISQFTDTESEKQDGKVVC